ncbi:hypothetical protein Drorol1_Dr00020270 [Drosera rotundifolia]
MLEKVFEIVESEKGVVAADDARCSEIGASILRKSGHAVDDVVATALCLGVVSPISSDVGGGTFMLLYSPSTGKATTFDSRDTALAAATKVYYEIDVLRQGSSIGDVAILKLFVIGGYHVRQGTRLIANLHKIQRDPSMWINPLEFQPENFLTTNLDVDVRGSQEFELIPFGAGRRKCPGITLGLQMVQLILAALLHGFEITASSDVPIDITGNPGLTMKATPLQVLIKPHLLENLYQ